MPARNLDVRTIAAATAGLCLLAAAAAFLVQGDEGDGLVLLETPYELIIIEDDLDAESVGVIGTLDPAVLAAILIEEDEGWGAGDALADASGLIIIEEDRAERLFAALVGSVGSVDIALPRLPETLDRVGIASPRRVAAPSRDRVRQTAGIAAMEAEVADVDPGPSRVALNQVQEVVVREVESLTPEIIDSSIRRQLPRVRACYERQLKSDSGLSGRLVLAMSVQPGGAVTRAWITGDQIGDEELTACVTKAVGTFQFPQSTESVAVEYPLHFKAGW